MSKSRLVSMGLMAAIALAGSWIAGSRDTTAQTVTKPQPKKTAVGKKVSATTSLPQRVEQRKVVLDRNERMRLEIINQLEFTPKPFLPRPPFPFPRFFCILPPATSAAAIDPHRSLFVHDRATLDAAGTDFSLNRTLTQIAGQVVPVVSGTTAVTIFRQLWDTQNAAPGVTSGPHCSDNGGTLNGFTIACPRNEGSEALGTDGDIQARMNQYAPLALVNRLDLAHQGWRNCGEHRIIYGKKGAFIAKNLLIFEAVLPNPRPGCREGCLPVAEFWKSLSAITNPVTRAQRLEMFFYTGLPGFRPVVHVDHYSAKGVTGGYGSSGSGQIRTNQFLQTGVFQPWLLKEFKTVIDCGVSPCTFTMVPIMVKVNPHGPLWNEDHPHPLGPAFRADTAAQIARLSDGALTGIGYEVDLAHDAGQSMSLVGAGFVDNYRDQMNSAASVGFRAALGAGALTADQISNRALTQSCAGCHMPSTFGINVAGSIGTVTTPVGSPVPTTDRWPNVVPAGFVHVDVLPASVLPELAANPAAFPGGLGQIISPALLDFFLPERRNFLLGQLNGKRCRCVNRFIFLSPALQRQAFEISARVDKQFADRFEILEQKILEADMNATDESRDTRMFQEQATLLAERDRALIGELERGGIKLPEGELLDLRPQTMRLRAGTVATDDPKRASALRTAEINELLRQEPPRRTVTGSFRPH